MRKFNIKNMKLSGLLALAMVLCLLVGSLAYFTDRVSKDASFSTVETGVDIEPEIDPEATPDDPTKDPDDYEDPTPDDPTDDLTNWWAYLNSIAKVNFNPGDHMTLNFYLANKGELDVKVRETFIITSTKDLTANAEEFKLFTAISEDANGAATGTAVAGTMERIDATHYKYTIAESSISAGESAAKAYYLVFASGSSNAFQGATCTVDYVAEAMQSNGDWVTAATAELTMGNQTFNVVPEA